ALLGTTLAFGGSLWLPGQVTAAISDLAGEWSITTNPVGPWAYGYLSANSSTSQAIDNRNFLETGATPGNAGFVPYNMFSEVSGGWTTGLGFPQAGVLNLPGEANTFGNGLNDWPSAAGENPNYPNGIIGGHSPNCTFCSGWYGARFTAPETGVYDIEMKSWQTGIYPVIPPNPTFGGATRPMQVRIDKAVGSNRTNLVRAVQVTRHGVINIDGTPQYTAADAPTPGNPMSYATAEDEIAAALRSSVHPNLYRVTNLQLNAGESVVFSFAAQQGVNFAGFNGFNVIVRSGADRIATTRWDLSDDWSVSGATATGIGPDATWSYGILKNGSFAAYDRVKTGFTAEDINTPERENHGWGTQEPGWFVAGVADPAEGPFVGGMMKDGDGFNFTAIAGSGQFVGANGDWSGGKVALHTPTTEIDAAQTSVIRWTAPRNMSVNAQGGMWRLTLPDETDRRHSYELRKGATVLASGTIDELGFAPTDTNSANPEAFSVNGIAVMAGDILELRISPLSTGGGSLTADFDGNGIVDENDLAQWRGDYLTTGGSDADGNGISDGNDFLAWQRELGMTAGASATPSFIGVDFTVSEAAVAAIPEPAGSSLVLIVAGCLAARRRRI
ncbi:MAG TPA: hypothetical protein PKC18_12695, partial [Lacipirellulaceae bacterium]|nr:hypothetical protein [Lacipirellulaceae bacterium]